MSQPSKPRYRTTNWKQYNASLKARGSLTVWLDKRVCWFAAASGKRGRSPKFSDAAIQFCLTLKNLFGLALRQTTGLVQSVLQLSGLAWPVPDFSTLCRRQLALNVQVPYTRSQGGLHLLVDSTGIKFLGEGEWKCKKHGPERRRQWRKLHIGIDAQTLQIRAICVTSNNVSDAAVLPDLLQQLPDNEALEGLTGDGAYDTQPAHEAVIEQELFQSFLLARMLKYAKAVSLFIAMQRLPHAGGWGEVSGSAGVAITGAAWWKPR